MDNAEPLSRVLIVEDNLLVEMCLRDMLQEIGADEISAVPTVFAAIQKIEREAISLAIIDVQLGSDNGLVVADLCATNGIPVILSTGFGDELEQAVGKWEVLLRKPYSLAQLTAAIDKVRAQPTAGG